ncbi:MAG: ABC transporter substrate-binding protein [Spirochaetes bacterium]|nr:ABC transporter substrate-binding protein [Spirochaetota bacterium]
MKKIHLLVCLFFLLFSSSVFSKHSVQDSTGRTVKLPRKIKRISLTGRAVIMISDVAYMFPQAVDQISAIAETTQRLDDFLNIVDPKLDQKSRLDRMAGAEQILATRPDLVIMKSYLAKKFGEPLIRLGIPVVYLDLETPDQYLRDIKIVGSVFKNERRAQVISDFYHSKMDRVKQQVNQLKDAERPRTLFLYYSDKGGTVSFNVPPQSWMQTQLVHMAGGTPVWEKQYQGKGWMTVNFEQIASWDPDHIYLVAYHLDIQQVVQKVLADSNWQNLTALRNNKIKGFPVDYYSWDQPDSRWILGLQWLAKDLHPEIFQNIDIEEEIIEFYRELYQLEQQVIKEQILPKYTGGIPGQ